MQEGPSVPLIGASNQSKLLVNGVESVCLIDTGSMVTTISESFFKSLSPSPELRSLTEFGLSLTGANDAPIPYSGYALLELCLPSCSESKVLAPVLVVLDTKFSETVPIIIGTNVLHAFSSKNSEDSMPDEWTSALSALQGGNSITVRSL